METNLVNALVQALAQQHTVAIQPVVPAASMSAELIRQMIALLGTVFTGVMVYYMARLKAQTENANAKQEKAAVHLEETALKSDQKMDKVVAAAGVVTEVAQTADHKLDALAKVADATHKLTNSNMGIQLRLNSELRARIARMSEGTPSHDGDLKDAIEAKLQLKQHEEQQAKVDAKYPEGIPNAQSVPHMPIPAPKPEEPAPLLFSPAQLEQIKALMSKN